MSDSHYTFDEKSPSTGPAWWNRALVWCDDHRRGLLVGAAALQVVLLLAMTGLNAAPYFVGETIRLKVVPVDPRDLFRGDYVILRYDLSTVPAEGIEGIADSRSGGDHWRPHEPEEQTVYVSLEKDVQGDCWHATKFSVRRPTSGKFLRGTYRRYCYGGTNIIYGLESFYVPEGTGRQYEDAARQRKLVAEIALAPWGTGKLRKLIVE